MTQQYMAGYPPGQQSPRSAFAGGPQVRSPSFGDPAGQYRSTQPPPLVQDQAAYSGPAGRARSHSQPGFDPYAPQPTGGQLTLYNQQTQLAPVAPVAADGTLLPPPIAADGTLLPLAVAPDGSLIPPPVAPDGSFVPGPRQRTYSSGSRHSSHSHRSRRSSRSVRSRHEAEIDEVERRPSWADSIMAVWGAFKGAWDKRTA